MSWTDRSNRSAIAVGAFFCLTFLALAGRYADFALDDAFITYRYSQNLARGHGIVWNVSEAPVEGYTSLLWVVVNAGAIAVGIDPLGFSKAVSLLAALGCIGGLAFACRRRHRAVAAIAVGALGLSPPFAFLSMQGMETTATALLLLAVAAFSLRVARRPSVAAIAGWFCFAFLAALSRPDSLPFSAGTGLGLVAVLALRREVAAVPPFLAIGALFAILGAGYLHWRVSYFGELFPNPYYIKVRTESGLLKSAGSAYLASFLRTILLPYLALFGALLPFGFRRDRLLDAAPILLGCGAAAVMLLTIVPVQGHLWRFAFPFYPALLLALLASTSDAAWWRRGALATPSLFALATPWLLALALGAWTLRTLPETDETAEYRTPRDRVLAGRSLAGLEGTMYTQASGALPFYSGWRSLDHLGLTSREIARHGVSREVLSRLDPDLVVMRSDIRGRYRPRREDQQVVDRFLGERGFVAVAAIRRSLGYSLFYFARPDSPRFEEIARRLRGIEGADYGELEAALPETGPPALPAGG